MGIRREATSLSPTERDRYLGAVKTLKSTIALSRGGERISVYDQFVAIHLGVTRRWLNAGLAFIGDGGHGNSGFLPWHREFLLRYERELQAVDPSVTLPYWDWTQHHRSATVLFTDDYMSPNGGPGGGVVVSGPFSRNEGWEVDERLHVPFLANDPNSDGSTLLRFGPGLRRNMMPFEELASSGNVATALAAPNYTTFRPTLEAGSRLHNFGHGWTGGSMMMMSSPQDPLFFMHHANVDRIWALWQDDGHTFDYPAAGRPTGHNLNDPMWPWDGGQSRTVRWIEALLPEILPGDQVQPADVLDYRGLNFSYG